jgi:hypothetical protein
LRQKHGENGVAACDRCNRQRLFFGAGDRQGFPLFVRTASQRGHRIDGERLVDTDDTKTIGSDIGTIQKACSVASSARTHGEENQMRKTNLFAAAAAALIVACVWGWVSPTGTKAAAPTGVQIDPFQAMVNAQSMPSSHYDDYSLVFN